MRLCCLFLLSQLCMCCLQLGFLSTYLSEPIVKAFTSAAAFHVTVSQLQSMLGLRLPRYAGAFSLFKVRNGITQTVFSFSVYLCNNSSNNWSSITEYDWAQMNQASQRLPLNPQTLASVMENVPHTNLAELVISLLCLAVLVPVKEVNSRFRERLRTPIPIEIITVSLHFTTFEKIWIDLEWLTDEWNFCTNICHSSAN